MESMERDAALQSGIYFEKTVAISNSAANRRHCAMALPRWFVTEHGDKLRSSVLLRCGSSAWRVQLNLSFRPHSLIPEVKFSGGWRAFAVANDLATGDSLIFSLRAMSEFDVEIFREIRGPPTQQAPRKRLHAFEFPKEKVTKSVGCGHRNSDVAERSAGRVISEFLEKRKSQAESVQVKEMMHEWQGQNFFTKTLTPGAVSKAFQLTLPTRFMQHYGRKIQQHIVLQSVADRKIWTLKICVYFPEKRPQFIMEGGNWRAFVRSNSLVEGDQLTFTLVAMSKFEVVIHRSGERPEVVEKSKGSAFSQAWQRPSTMSLGPQHMDWTGRCSSVSVDRELSSGLFTEKEEAEDYSHSESPSDMDYRTFERWYEGTSKKVCQQASY